MVVSRLFIVSFGATVVADGMLFGWPQQYPKRSGTPVNRNTA
jgi:hypothetical protein